MGMIPRLYVFYMYVRLTLLVVHYIINRKVIYIYHNYMHCI